MARIDATACVAGGARIADSAEIGPYCIVGPAAELRDGVRLMSHVIVDGHTTIGERTIVHPFASLGSPPQATAYKGEPTRLAIGADCIIREYVTMCTGTAQGRGVTKVGDRGFFMAYCHVAHDCQVGSDVSLANGATLAGHVVVGDYTVIGGLTAIHQFVRIGPCVMMGGTSGLGADIIPFGLAQGMPARLRGLNIIGMRRRGFSETTIRTLRTAYRRLFHGDGKIAERIESLEKEFADEPAVAQIVAFIRQPRERDLCLPKRPLEAGRE